MSNKKALVIDANALIHRAWHALPPMTAQDGKLVNAVYGFTSILIKILGAERPDVLAVCWDTEAPTFRHEQLETYKATRVKQDQAFYDQFDDVKEVVEVLGGTNLELDGYEADDLLGTLAVKLEKDGYKVLLLTGDKDAWQLISENVNVVAFKKGVSETVVYTPETLEKITGLRPDQVVDFKAVRGDASDNIPGIKGIGEKTMTELLQKYDDLKGVFKAAKNESSDIKPGVRKKLLEGESVAMETLPIVRIVTNAPLKVKTRDLLRRKVDQDEAVKLFARFGFKSLISRLFGKQTNHEQRTTNNDSAQKKRSSKFEIRSSIEYRDVKDVENLKNFLDEVSKEGRLYVYLPEVLQESLFEDLPQVVLGSEKVTATIAKAVLDDKSSRELLRKMISDEGIRKVGHGLKAIWHWAGALGMELKGMDFDTEIAAYLLAAGERGHDLKSVAALKLEKFLDVGKYVEALDAVRELEGRLKEELEEQKLDQVMQRFEIPLIGILAEMEKKGLKVDVKYFKKLADELRKEKKSLEKKMHKLAGEEFNPLSPKQLGHILFEVLEMPSQGIKRGKTGISTAASELEKLHGQHEIIEMIEDYRELAKLLSTYVEAIPELADDEGRVHTTFNQAVTATGRLSSSEPNLQNIPIRTELGRRVRKGFIAPKGYKLLACDYSQIELRIAAALAKDKVMLEAFEKGMDIHTATAAKIWDLELKDVSKDQRRVAKAINFGLLFGQGPQGLSRVADISYNEAREFIAKYFEAFEGIKEYMTVSKALAKKQGYIETLFGRKRPLPEINSPLQMVRAQAERMAINMPIQGTEADLIKLAMIEVAKELPKVSKQARLLLQVHDELVLEVPEKEVKKVAKLVVETMQNVENIGCPIVVDAKAGKNWEEMTAIK
ncbi:DNA polymerase I [Candidatus Peregrinibacteria bacterium]|nr:DNA polymerase I [Candidatus Peregrinibacteria bacterium]